MSIFRTAAPVGSAEGEAAPSGTAATANSPSRPDRKWVWFSYIGVVAAAVVAWRVNHQLSPDSPAIPEGLSVLVLLFVLAQVIERALEPAVRLTISPDKTQVRNEATVEAANNPTDPAKAQTAANAQRDLDVERANVAVAVWAVATTLGMLLAAVSGAYLLHALGVKGLGDKPWIDVVVTGLAIGAGTKPVHDLITRIDAAKQAARDPRETTN